MKKRHSRIGLISSLAIHSSVFAGIFAVMQMPKPLPPTEEVSSISIEMLAARLEQEQVAVTTEEIVKEEIKDMPEPEPEPEPIVKPKIEPPKPKEKPKEKPKDKPKEKEKPKEKLKEKQKEKPKEKPKVEKPPVKALEKGPEVKQGIVAKAIPNATQGMQNQQGIANGSPKGSGTVNSGSASSGEINAYKAQLQRTLQQRANNAYPQREKMMRKTGTVTLSFQLSSTGQVTNVQVINSSGNSNLDAAAVKAAQSTKMSSPPPAGFPTSLTVPVKFSIQ
ncbi:MULTISPECIES: energy transducer TonB [Glaesserella]|uniref:Protein TonB n=1 Tax=Glaesserella australis TaxID=2094024 RepID=A0A328BXP0_9PAST|nr:MULTISPECIES: energy transducer TonB [Glaesserella]AUI66108.1 energy transducer TonB [Glaesserella sp. 15-184]RAL17842.1 energy transducer TonB [Glaesserella australis]